MLLVWHGTIWNLAFYLLTSVFITFARHLEQPKTSLPRQISALRAPLFKTNVLFEAECKKLCTMDPECTFPHLYSKPMYSLRQSARSCAQWTQSVPSCTRVYLPAASASCWLSVIFFGRLLSFYFCDPTSSVKGLFERCWGPSWLSLLLFTSLLCLAEVCDSVGDV